MLQLPQVTQAQQKFKEYKLSVQLRGPLYLIRITERQASRLPILQHQVSKRELTRLGYLMEVYGLRISSVVRLLFFTRGCPMFIGQPLSM